MDFRDFLAHNGSFGGKIGEGWCDVHPSFPTKSFLLFGL